MASSFWNAAQLIQTLAPCKRAGSCCERRQARTDDTPLTFANSEDSGLLPQSS